MGTALSFLFICQLHDCALLSRPLRNVAAGPPFRLPPQDGPPWYRDVRTISGVGCSHGGNVVPALVKRAGRVVAMSTTMRCVPAVVCRVPPVEMEPATPRAPYGYRRLPGLPAGPLRTIPPRAKVNEYATEQGPLAAGVGRRGSGGHDNGQGAGRVDPVAGGRVDHHAS